MMVSFGKCTRNVSFVSCMKPKQIFDMGHFRETTQQFLRFKSSLSDVGLQKLQQWASANSIFLPSRQFWCLLRLPPTPHFTFRITRPNPTFACSPPGRSLELHFGGDFVRLEPVPSLQFLTPFGYLNLITNSIFRPWLVSGEIFPIISCNRIARGKLQSVWVRQKCPIFIFFYLRKFPNFGLHSSTLAFGKSKNIAGSEV